MNTVSPGHNGCAQLLRSASGLECSMVELEDEEECAAVNMSMAEAFVSMFADEFTQVTQLSPDQLGSLCVTLHTPTTSGAAPHKATARLDSPVPGDPVTCNGVSVTSKAPLACDGPPLACNGAPLSAPHTPLRPSHDAYDSPNLTPTNPSFPVTPDTPATPTSLTNTPTNKPAQHHATCLQQTTSPSHADRGRAPTAKNPRRELFPESPKLTDLSRSKENTDPSKLYVTASDMAYFDDTIDPAYLEDTIILESPKNSPSLLPHQPSTKKTLVKNLCSELESVHISNPPAGSRKHLTDVSNSTTSVSAAKGKSHSAVKRKDSLVMTNTAPTKVKGWGHKCGNLSGSGNHNVSGNHGSFIKHRAADHDVPVRHNQSGNHSSFIIHSASMNLSRSSNHDVSVRHDQSRCDSSMSVSVSPPSWILRLSNSELREKLLALGEHPGPINDSTRAAYQVYLAKVQAGVQPKGNRGYKGKAGKQLG